MRNAREVVRIAVGCVAFAAGCGRLGFDSVSDAQVDAIVNVDVPPDFTNGTRLRAYRMVDATGTGPLVDWYDTVLDTHCTFATAADGVLRCLPSRSKQNVFMDPGCTQPLAVLFPVYDIGCGPGEKYARDGDGSGRVYAMGEAYLPNVYADFGVGCSDTGGNNYAHLRGAEVDPTTFVAARERLAYHGRLAAIEWVAEDGATQLSGTFVDQLYPPSLPGGPTVSSKTRCTLQELDPGIAYCVSPDVTPLAQLAYSDAGCTQELIEYNGVVKTSYVEVTGSGLCTNNTRVIAIGAELTAPAYQLTATGCTAWMPQSYQHFYEILGETAAAGFAAFHLEVGTSGTGRLRTTHWRDADGNGGPAAAFDTVRGRRCEPIVEYSSNLLVCVPVPGDLNGYFYSDAACTMLVHTGNLSCRSGADALWFPVSPNYTCEGDRYEIEGNGITLPHTPLWWQSFPGLPCFAVDYAQTEAIQFTGNDIPGATLPAMHAQTD